MTEDKSRIVKPGEFVQQISRIVRRTTESTRNDEPFKATIDASYTGGDPAVLLPGETTASSDTKKSFFPFGWTFPSASAEILVAPIGNDLGIVGKIGSVALGSPNTGAYWLLPFNVHPEVMTTVGAASNNNVRAVRIFYDAPLTVANVYIDVAVGNAGGLFAVALYDSLGTTKVLDSGAINCATNGVKTAAISPAVTLPFGWYWYAWTSNDTTVTVRAATSSLTITNLINQGTVQRISAGNSSASGVLPSTLGTLTGVSHADLPLAKLQS